MKKRTLLLLACLAMVTIAACTSPVAWTELDEEMIVVSAQLTD